MRKKKVEEVLTVEEAVELIEEATAPKIGRLEVAGNEDFNKLVAKVNELVEWANKDCC